MRMATWIESLHTSSLLLLFTIPAARLSSRTNIKSTVIDSPPGLVSFSGKNKKNTFSKTQQNVNNYFCRQLD